MFRILNVYMIYVYDWILVAFQLRTTKIVHKHKSATPTEPATSAAALASKKLVLWNIGIRYPESGI